MSESTQKPSVLVVDDEENFLKLAELVLSREGYRVVTASNGVDALAYADREKFRLAILDIKMEPMTGIQVLAELKKRDPRTQIVMVTGYQTEDTRNECVKLGAAAFLTKPVQLSDLKDVLRHLMGADHLLQGR
jgi:DNA-binding NtrC family response regulator